ncbi:phosphatase PAP2 family protein [Cellulophaga sp. HaHa_2_95]|uniref:phosphatase PAP2 family protein n=1 Tax=unclassified Cellulophaga TaxID=2634405 RepID=UPI001C4F0912|nr:MULTISPECIES: phosphatase PAP2 family protein [unclassified Cellulophaga]QXP51432.1 phosphatase PAP2 family protein [Cellulophaga sp. HaHa_2_1]QXP56244.1 phosphatase PAP2 family protein [Cellulophaga sp. HaHa_2_95]
MKRKILTILVIFILGKATAQLDSTTVKPKTNLFKKSTVPLSLIGAGILLSDSGFEKSFNTNSRNWIGNDFETNLDDYTRYAPVATLFISDVAGVQAKNHWFDQTKHLAISMILTDVFTRALKKNIYKLRPDGSNENAFPSGHTSITFASGAVVYEEFKEASPLLAYSGYGFATLTGGLRLANNKHWISDVLAGAGLGILVTKLVYHFDYLFKWNPFIHSKDMSLIPRYSEGNVGVYFSKKF